MADLSDIKFYLSGGTSNVDNNASLGGIISTQQILSQSATAPTTITGVTINDAAGNAVGAGTLTYLFTGQTLQWSPLGGTIGVAVDVSADGTYAIQAANNGGVIICTVVAGSLAGSNQTNSITIANLDNKIFDDVSKDESDVGSTSHRAIYIKNDSTDIKKSLVIWIGSNTPGEDVINIGLDPAGLGGTAAEEDIANTAALTWAASITTVTQTAHGYTVNETVVVAGCTPSAFDGTFTILTVPDANTFTYAQTPDPSGPTTVHGTTTSEAAAPTGVTFSSPTTEATALTVGTLGVNEVYPIWIRRQVPAEVATEQLDNNFVLSFRVKV